MIKGSARRLAVSVLSGSLGGLLFGYDLGAISGATVGLRAEFSLSPARFGIAIGAAIFGTIVGSIGIGIVADAVSRRRSLLCSGLIYVAGILASASAAGLPLFIAGRFCCGVAIGLLSVVAPMYLAEISPAHLRGRLVGLFQVSLSVGVVLGFVWSYVLTRLVDPQVVWRYSLGSGAMLGLLFAAALAGACESPRWLMLRQRPAEAKEALQTLVSNDFDAELAGLTAALQISDGSQSDRLFTRQHAKPIFLAVSIAVFNQLSGVNILLFYILDILHDFSAGQLNGRKYAILVSIMSLLVTSLGVSVIDKTGRKPLLLTGAAGMGICLLLLPAVRYFAWPPATVVLVLISYNIFFSFSQGPIIWIYLSEIFPLPVRSRGQSLGGSVHWIVNAMLVSSFPAIADRFGSTVFVALSAMLIVQFLVILFVYPETNRRILEAMPSAAGR